MRDLLTPKKKRGRILVLSGPSGVGKATVITKFLNEPKLNLRYSISMTTRKPRNGEIDGVHYYFVTVPHFKYEIKNGSFIEWAEFVGNYYGTPRRAVEELLDQGYNVILEIEFEGAKQVLNTLDDYISIFLVPPSIEELERRLRTRNTESDEQIKLRIAKASFEMLQKDLYNYVVVNDDADRAAQEMRDIIAKELGIQ